MEIKQILNNFLEVSEELGNDSAISLIKDFAEKNGMECHLVRNAELFF